MFLTYGMYLSFSFLMSCPEPPMGISSVGSFPVLSGGSLIIFQLFRCRNLALNRFFYIRGRHGGVSLGVSVHPHTSVHHLYVHMPLYLWMPPYICMPPYPLYICMFSLCSPYVIVTWEASVHLICLGIFWEILVFQCWSVHPFATQFITVMPFASHHCGLLLYWTGYLWVSAMLHVLVPFFVVFIISQTSNTTAMTTTPPVTVVSSNTSSFLAVVTMAPFLMGLLATSGQHDLVLPPLLTPRHSWSVVGLATVPQQQPPFQMPLQAYTNYAMGHPQVSFSFRVESPTILYFICVGVCSGVCFLLQLTCWILYSPMGAQLFGFAPFQPFGAYPWEVYMQPRDGSLAHNMSAQSGCSLHCFE